jgi:uncharacterized protein with von Willebrand factor type A (vWA) domain
MTLPQATRPFVRFAQLLRHAGFAVSPDQTIGFIAAVGLLGPRDMTDIHRAGRALFAVPPERMAEYDALFRAVFLDQVLQAPAEGEEEDEVVAHEPTGETRDIEADEDESPIGAEPSGAERLGQRSLRPEGEAEALARLLREAPTALPRRRSFRRQAARRGDRLDLRRALRQAVRRDGDVLTLPRTRRRTRQRRVLLLIDVSGSMKDRSDASLRLAHALVQAADRAEVFTLGTRLTRITAALRPSDRAQALARAALAVADFDGGTRIGEALHAYLSVPRYAGFARGAAVVILSDGLERGSPEAMIDAMARLSRIAWRVSFLSPLASDPAYRPATAALAGALPWIDSLADGASTEAIAQHILTLVEDARRTRP